MRITAGRAHYSHQIFIKYTTTADVPVQATLELRVPGGDGIVYGHTGLNPELVPLLKRLLAAQARPAAAGGSEAPVTDVVTDAITWD